MHQLSSNTKSIRFSFAPNIKKKCLQTKKSFNFEPFLWTMSTLKCKQSNISTLSPSHCTIKCFNDWKYLRKILNSNLVRFGSKNKLVCLIKCAHLDLLNKDCFNLFQVYFWRFLSCTKDIWLLQADQEFWSLMQPF